MPESSFSLNMRWVSQNKHVPENVFSFFIKFKREAKLKKNNMYLTTLCKKTFLFPDN